MNKKIFIVLILSVCVIVATAALSLRSQPQPLVVLSTSPSNQSSQNPYLPLIITLNRAPKANEVVVSIVPSTKTSNTIEENIVKITPETTFLSETLYTVSLNTTPPYTFNFTTQTTVENSPGSNDITRQANEQYLQKNATQDAVLADIRTHTPVAQPGFTISYSYANNTYTVALRPPYDQNKLVFLDWIKQGGVVDTSTLRIQYINQ